MSAATVILSPTRELSLQTLRVLQTLSSQIKQPKINIIGINGGESMEKQFSLLSSNPDVIVATPGRLAHHLSEIPDFHLRHCDLVIFDEADRLFEMGFALQIRQICHGMPSTESGRQTLLFSATMPKVLVEFTRSGVMDSDPNVVRLDKDATVSAELRIGFVCVRSREKDAALIHLLRDVLPKAKCVTKNDDAGAYVSTKSNTPKNDVDDDNNNDDNNDDDDKDSESIDNDNNNNKRRDRKKKKQKKLEFRGGVVSGSITDSSTTHRTKLGLTLIFAATRHHVDYLTILINNSGIGSCQSNHQEGSNSSSSNSGGGDVATCIYGTMDQEARKQNLYSFRSGKTPILVVTDVAARGIDVPLIDHVIHYSFPSNVKLFVHRSGRAARAGRIGYCWGLVDAEEMGYMVDLYLFLGRKLSTGQTEYDEKISSSGQSYDDNDDNETTNNYSCQRKEERDNHTMETDVMYNLDEMTPEMVHYGSVPESTLTDEVENVRRIVESELTASHDAEVLRSLVRVCDNAMKQYRRSRPEASRQGMSRAKAILEGRKEVSGKRVGGGMIPSHPVLRRVEVNRIMSMHRARSNNNGNNNKDGEKDLRNKLDQLKRREDFLRAMSNFRPKETIFESFATGGGKTTGVVSHLDKGSTTSGISTNNKKKNSSAAYDAMKNMRRQMKLAHNKGVSLVVAGSDAARTINGERDSQEHGQEESNSDHNNNDNVDDINENRMNNGGKNTSPPLPQKKERVVIVEKRRLSKAERKRLKKQGGSNIVLSSSKLSAVHGTQENTIKKTKNKRGQDFRDHAFYIDNEATHDSEEAQRGRHIEAAMQPSSANTNDGTASALRLEQAMLDIVGDENADLVKKHRIMRWDKSKRKYVQTTLGSELSGDSKTKKLRLESGQFIKSDKAKLGELYEKWQKKTHQSIGRVGVFDDVTDNNEDNNEDDGGQKGGGRRAKTKGARQNSGGTPNVESDLKTSTQIRKKREADKKMKLKNMKKSDRSKLETKKRTARNAKVAQAAAEGRGWQGKKGYSGRYGAQVKGKLGKK